IGRFCDAAHDATRERFGHGPLTRYGADLVVPDETLAEIVALKGVTAHYAMAPREHEPPYLQQRTMPTEITGALDAPGPGGLAPSFGSDWHEAADDGARLRVVVDQVASLADPSAQAWHQRLCGPR